jgi:hypothetical protein
LVLEVQEVLVMEQMEMTPGLTRLVPFWQKEVREDLDVLDQIPVLVVQEELPVVALEQSFIAGVMEEQVEMPAMDRVDLEVLRQEPERTAHPEPSSGVP